MNLNTKYRDRLINLLKELFQLDQPELDFGLYQIMHAKSDQIQHFLEHDLLNEIEEAFGEVDANHVAEKKAEYELAYDQARNFGAPDPEQAPAVKGARAAYEAAKESGSSEAEIYDHLYRFFERYYDNGDFMSRRYYARESDTRAAPYAVPYDGREIYFHWATKDQYYIKSSERLTNYSFDLNQALAKEITRQKKSAGRYRDSIDDTRNEAPLKVHFRIVDATEGAHDNVKESKNEKRFFVPHEPCPAEVDRQGELILNFEYKPLPNGKYELDETAIKAEYGSINKGDMPEYWMAEVFLDAIDKLGEVLPAAYSQHLRVLAPPNSADTKPKKRPLLVKYLQKYTSRNTMDYFIHKDLGGFLRRELDFYIKNEIMRLDDLDDADAPQVEDYLDKIKVLRRIARQIIDFLAQLEEFQKKLWLKKKFVTETNYCITLDRVPKELYPEIAANDAQRREWCVLFHIEDIEGDLHTPAYSKPLTVEFLKSNPFLVLDTALFDESFKNRLLNEINNLDKHCEGLLAHSENFQSLNLMENKFKRIVGCVYIDPPYNSPNSEIAYKNNYKHSSFLSLISNRLEISKEFLKSTGSHITAIDKNEENGVSAVIQESFPENNNVLVTVEHNKKGIQGDHFSYTNEYAIFSVPYEKKNLNRIKRKLANTSGLILETGAANHYVPMQQVAFILLLSMKMKLL